MTYASQQLAEALQKLAQRAEDSQDYSAHHLPVAIEPEQAEFPSPVAEFLEITSDYAKLTKAVNSGVY